MAAPFVERTLRKLKTDGVNRTQVVLGIAVLALGILSLVSVVRAQGPPARDTNESEISGSARGASIKLPLQLGENLSYGAVTKSPDEAAEEDNLAKQLSNPIASLISVPFQDRLAKVIFNSYLRHQSVFVRSK